VDILRSHASQHVNKTQVAQSEKIAGSLEKSICTICNDGYLYNLGIIESKVATGEFGEQYTTLNLQDPAQVTKVKRQLIDGFMRTTKTPDSFDNTFEDLKKLAAVLGHEAETLHKLMEEVEQIRLSTRRIEARVMDVLMEGASEDRGLALYAALMQLDDLRKYNNRCLAYKKTLGIFGRGQLTGRDYFNEKLMNSITYESAKVPAWVRNGKGMVKAGYLGVKATASAGRRVAGAIWDTVRKPFRRSKAASSFLDEGLDPVAPLVSDKDTMAQMARCANVLARQAVAKQEWSMLPLSLGVIDSQDDDEKPASEAVDEAVDEPTPTPKLMRVADKGPSMVEISSRASAGSFKAAEPVEEPAEAGKAATVEAKKAGESAGETISKSEAQAEAKAEDGWVDVGRKLGIEGDLTWDDAAFSAFWLYQNDIAAALDIKNFFWDGARATLDYVTISTTLVWLANDFYHGRFNKRMCPKIRNWIEFLDGANVGKEVSGPNSNYTIRGTQKKTKTQYCEMSRFMVVHQVHEEAMELLFTTCNLRQLATNGTWDTVEQCVRGCLPSTTWSPTNHDTNATRVCLSPPTKQQVQSADEFVHAEGNHSGNMTEAEFWDSENFIQLMEYRDAARAAFDLELKQICEAEGGAERVLAEDWTALCWGRFCPECSTKCVRMTMETVVRQAARKCPPRS